MLFCMAVDAQHLAIERAVIRSVSDVVELEPLAAAAGFAAILGAK
jgi:hypothetical protein